MSGVSPPAPQPAASARRLAQPRTRPQVPLRRFAANQNIRANHKLATQVSLSVIPQFSPQIQSTFASTIQERIPPCNRPQFCKCASTQKRAGTPLAIKAAQISRHLTAPTPPPPAAYLNQPPPTIFFPLSTHSHTQPSPHSHFSPFPSQQPKIIATIINNGSHQANRPQVHRWQGPA